MFLYEPLSLFKKIIQPVSFIFIFDDAFFQPELGWSVWGSVGWTKTAGGLNWRMPNRLGS